jgi:hypothetical protein
MSIRAFQVELTAHHNQLLWFCSNGQPVEMSQLAQSLTGRNRPTPPLGLGTAKKKTTALRVGIKTRLACTKLRVPKQSESSVAQNFL